MSEEKKAESPLTYHTNTQSNDLILEEISEYNKINAIYSTLTETIKVATQTEITVNDLGKIIYTATGTLTVDDLIQAIKPYTPQQIFNFNKPQCLKWLEEAIRMHSRPWLDEKTRNNWYQIVDFFLKYVEDIHNVNLSLPPLFLVAHYLDLTLFDLLIQQGADLTQTLSHNDTVLHWLAIKDEEKARIIMERVFKGLKKKSKLTEIINAQNHGGETALWRAVMSRSWKNVFLLLASGADTDIAISQPERTPLHQATLFNNLKMIEILVAYRAGFLKQTRLLPTKVKQAVTHKTFKQILTFFREFEIKAQADREYDHANHSKKVPLQTAKGEESPKQIAINNGFHRLVDFFTKWECMTEEERKLERERIKEDCRKELLEQPYQQIEESKNF